ncbi:DUF6286 domain-containing protein [Arthrobacter sp. Br18]|uniref:DUF6286 domain-containing protein n=1 Tax=Arthrobacter sp. Br18 TaxID=1312954 RepID=UPI00047CE3E5|nr:DUF6286 domain-containing protein [Arthrobacter sp. Br18]
MSPKPTSPALRRRSSRSLPATIIAILLLTTAALAVWIGVTRITTAEWPPFLASIREDVASLAWDSPALWTTAIILILIGLVLLLTAILPGKHNTARIQGPDSADEHFSETAMSRRGVARLAVAHVDQTDGVDSSTVKATAKKVDVHVRTPLHDAGNLSEQLTSSLTRKLQDVGLNPTPKVSVRVRATND